MKPTQNNVPTAPCHAQQWRVHVFKVFAPRKHNSRSFRGGSGHLLGIIDETDPKYREIGMGEKEGRGEREKKVGSTIRPSLRR